MALAAILQPVSSHAVALSLALLIGGVLGDAALWRSSNPVDVFPNCPSV